MDKPQLLIVLSRFPFPLQKGDKLRAFYQIKEFSRYFSITLFALTDEKIKTKYLSELKPFCSEIHTHQLSFWQKMSGMFRSFLNGNPFQVGYFQSHSAHQSIKKLLSEKKFDHIYCQLIRVSEYVKDYHLAPKTIDFMDALSMGIERRIEKQTIFTRWIFKMEAQRLRKYESRMMNFFEYKTIISQQDKHLIHHESQEEILVVPNGIDASFFEPFPIKKTHDFVFVGNMSYAPNIDAVHFIAQQLLPHFPNHTLLIAGSSPSTEIIKLAEKNAQITLTGWVEDIREAYHKGKIFLAPMQIGTGMQNKILEAMACGVPCVTTSLANNPIKGTHRENLMVANSVEEAVASINELTENKSLCNAIKQNAQQFVKENYTWEKACGQLIKELNA